MNNRARNELLFTRWQRLSLTSTVRCYVVAINDVAPHLRFNVFEIETIRFASSEGAEGSRHGRRYSEGIKGASKSIENGLWAPTIFVTPLFATGTKFPRYATASISSFLDNIGIYVGIFICIISCFDDDDQEIAYRSNLLSEMCIDPKLGWLCGVVLNDVFSEKVKQRWAWLLLGWVTVTEVRRTVERLNAAQNPLSNDTYSWCYRH